MRIEDKDTMEVYVAWVNSDLTEGRGYQRPLYVSESKAAVTRLGKGKSTQGCDAEVTQEVAVRIRGKWCAPVDFVAPRGAVDVTGDLEGLSKTEVLSEAR